MILIILTCLVAYFVRLYLIPAKRRQITVAVLGDLGRSPRIQYHCISLLNHQYSLSIIAYKGQQVMPEIMESEHAHIYYITQPQSIEGKKMYAARAILKILTLLADVTLIVLVKTPKPCLFIIQTPPAIPTLFLFQIYSTIYGVPLVIDWHNFTYSLLKLQGKSQIIVKCCYWYERIIGRNALIHLTVTEMMKNQLEEWNMIGEIVPLYDRPAQQFKILLADEKVTFLSSLNFAETEVSRSVLNESYCNAEVQIIDKSALLVSSTSWTSDEDFYILIRALEGYSNSKTASHPCIRCIITGKGPMKEEYMTKMSVANFKYVAFHSAWLSQEDYPKLIACADVGLSLHTSSSGLDLPMKIVDLIGVGVPTLALDFACLDELIHDGENGFKFRNSEELCALLLKILDGYPLNDTLAKITMGTKIAKEEGDWVENWIDVLLPLIQNVNGLT